MKEEKTKEEKGKSMEKLMDRMGEMLETCFGSVEKLMDRMGGVLETWLKDFGKKPIVSSIKVILLFWVVKTVYKGLKK